MPWVAGASSQTPTSPNRKPHPHPVAQKRPKWSRFCFWLPAVPWSLSPSLSCPPPPVPDGGSAATRTRTRADIIRCKRRDQTAKAHSSRSPSDPFIPLGFLLLRPLRSPSDHPCEAVTQPGRRRSLLHHRARRLPRTCSPLPGIQIWGLLFCPSDSVRPEARRGERDGLHWPPRRRHAAALQVQRRRPLARRQVHPPALLVPIRQHLPAMVPVSRLLSRSPLSLWLLLLRPCSPLPNASCERLVFRLQAKDCFQTPDGGYLPACLHHLAAIPFLLVTLS